MGKTAGIALNWGIRLCWLRVFSVEEIENPLGDRFDDRLSPGCARRHRHMGFCWDVSVDYGHGTHRNHWFGDERCLAHKMFTL